MENIEKHSLDWNGAEDTHAPGILTKAERKTIRLEVHVEPWFSGILPFEKWPRKDGAIVHETRQLLSLLRKVSAKGNFYVLGFSAQEFPKLCSEILADGHGIGSHGYWHAQGEEKGDASDLLARKYLPKDLVGYRSPYWFSTQRPGLCGGLFFRMLPMGALKTMIEEAGVFYLHPWEISGGSPKAEIPWPYKRHYLGRKTALMKFMELLHYYEWVR